MVVCERELLVTSGISAGLPVKKGNLPSCRMGPITTGIAGVYVFPSYPVVLSKKNQGLKMQTTEPNQRSNDERARPTVTHRELANAVRALAMDGVEAAKSGHPGMPMGAADIATVLFTKFMKFDACDPHWFDRDRFVLSAGHGSMLIYSLLYLLGFEGMALDELKRFRQLGSLTPGHPEYGHVPGVEVTTGPLGQGLASAVGMAIAEKMMASQFGDDLVNHRTYVLAGDGDLMEGISHEAISLAGHLRLNKLMVLFDDNQISIDGPVSLSESGDQLGRFIAAGWSVQRIDGHDCDAIAAAIEDAQGSELPSLIACRTTIGYGAPNKQGTAGVHGAPLGESEYAAARVELGIDYAAFDPPMDVRDSWRMAGLRGRHNRKDWEETVLQLNADTRAQFELRLSGNLPVELAQVFTSIKQEFVANPEALASRKSSQIVLEEINPILISTVGGSADLTGSNNTKSADLKPINADDFSGRYIHFGVREHAMAAAMNGIALHGGLIPYGGTFLVFSDYSRPAIRLAALMGQRVIHVMTHDSIGLGEDGPTHQPVEHLAALRAIPNLCVFRPADAVETTECWQVALERKDGPSVLALSRQNLELLRTAVDDVNLCMNGAYEISPSDGDAEVSIFASGSEVSIAVDAKRLLAAQNITARVVSVPCLDLFNERSAVDRAAVIGTSLVNVAVEAAIKMGWESIIGTDGLFVGMTGFGASAPYKELYEHFGITAERIATVARERLEQVA